MNAIAALPPSRMSRLGVHYLRGNTTFITMTSHSKWRYGTFSSSVFFFFYFLQLHYQIPGTFGLPFPGTEDEQPQEQRYPPKSGVCSLFVNPSWCKGILWIVSGQRGTSPLLFFDFQLPRDLLTCASGVRRVLTM